MTTKLKKINNETFEVLEHAQTPGFRRVFHIVLCVAVIYFIYIFAH